MKKFYLFIFAVVAIGSTIFAMEKQAVLTPKEQEMANRRARTAAREHQEIETGQYLREYLAGKKPWEPTTHAMYAGELFLTPEASKLQKGKFLARLQELLAARPNTANVIDEQTGRTPLINLLRRKFFLGKGEMFDLLLSHMSREAINVHEKPLYGGDFGKTALMYAAELPSPTWAMALLVAGADPNAVFTYLGDRPLTAVTFATTSMDASPETVYLLLKAQQVSKEGPQQYEAFLHKVALKLLNSSTPWEKLSSEEKEFREEQPYFGMIAFGRPVSRWTREEARKKMEALPADSYYNWTFTDRLIKDPKTNRNVWFGYLL